MSSRAASLSARALLVMLVAWTTYRYPLYGRLDAEHVAHALPVLWVPLLAAGGVVAGSAWAGPFCLGIALWAGAPIGPLMLIVAVMGIEAARRDVGRRMLIAFTVTWTAAGWLAPIVADGLSFDVNVAARAIDFDPGVVLGRVLLEIAAALSIAFLLLRGRTAALIALLLSTATLAAMAHAQPLAMVFSSGCIGIFHPLWPGYGAGPEVASVCALAVAPWVLPAGRMLRTSR